jgi:NAD-dependent aldehyde dehydrogenases
MKLKSVNPFTEEVNGEFEILSWKKVDAEIKKSRHAFAGWKAFSIQQRMVLIKNVGEVLKENKRQYAKIITSEMGKPIKQALREIDTCISFCEYFAENAAKLLEDEVVKTDFKNSYITFEPLGIILGIMPWNLPFYQVFRLAVPALVAGNVVILKHASNVPICAQEVERVFLKAGFPANVLKTLLIDSGTAMKLIREDTVEGVSLTGSLNAGSQVGALAGANIIKLVLELGGSDPFIVLDDVDVEKVALAAVQARITNCGQACIAAKRFIVMESIAKEFTEKFIYYLNTLQIGDPMDENTDIGPMAMKESISELDAQVNDAISKGATVIAGPKPPAHGFFFRPVVIVNANQGMAVAQQETFGPIAPIFVVKDEKEIIALANSTKVGLGATIWSKNINRAIKLIKKIDCAMVAINRTVKTDPRLPFGGIKKSGLGRELSHYGLKEFTNSKVVIIDNC